MTTIVALALATLKLRSTGGAAPYVPLPAWSAWIVQVPAAAMWTVVPATLQTPEVSELKVTVRPDDAVALTVKSASP